MTYFNDIYEIAIDNYGIITTSEANGVGARNKDLLRYVADGRLVRLAHGVYKLTHYVPVLNDPYAESVAIVGAEAYLYGESVIAMLDLAPTNPSRIFVATSKRVRKRLPKGLRVVCVKQAEPVAHYEGIPSQTVAAAIEACIGELMQERLVRAAKRARKLGYLSTEEENALLKRLGAYE